MSQKKPWWDDEEQYKDWLKTLPDDELDLIWRQCADSNRQERQQYESWRVFGHPSTPEMREDCENEFKRRFEGGERSERLMRHEAMRRKGITCS